MHRTTLTTLLPALCLLVCVGCDSGKDAEPAATPAPASTTPRADAKADAKAEPAGRGEDGGAPEPSDEASPVEEVEMEAAAAQRHQGEEGRMGRPMSKARRVGGKVGAPFAPPPPTGAAPAPEPSAEAYDSITDNAFIAVADDPRSTFSIDVDTAAYSNMRRFLKGGSLPPADAVRIEELINYFSYDYRSPAGGDPFSMTAEAGPCPWSETHRLVHVGLQGKIIDQSDVPARNLVFLFDVSGSMNNADKLPLLKRAFSLLADNLRPQDKVSIVVYAGASGVVLEPTSGKDKGEILAALDRLEAGGSTNGGAGIHSAYAMADKGFIEGGINRVILATDGDFNVGTTSEGELVRLIEDKRKSNVFLSVLGFGSGNLKDSTMEKLADKGNGNYAYIDSIAEARKVLVEEAGATLVTIAKDVKIQVEFNPAQISSFRLIGYENRILAHSDFNDDTKDAGEIGAGHSVTALYEVVPAGAKGSAGKVDDLKYQGKTKLSAAAGSGELMTVKVRYKAPEGSESKLLSFPIDDRDLALTETSRDFRFSAAVAGFGMLLRKSEHKGDATWKSVRALADEAKGSDPHGRRNELVELIDMAARLSDGGAVVEGRKGR